MEKGIARVCSLPAAVLCFLCVVVPLIYAIGLTYVREVIWSQPWPNGTFLPSPSATFGDFFQTQSQWMATHFYGVGLGHDYFPATYLPVEINGLVFHSVYAAHWASTAFFLAASMGAITFILWRKGAAVTALGLLIFLLSYPTIFTLVTGNMEGWVGALLLVMLAFGTRGRWKVAAIALGLAVAMKGVPIVFLPAICLGQNWRGAAKIVASCVGTVVTVTLTALLVLPGGLLDGFGVIDHLRASQSLYDSLLINTVAGTHFGNSFLNGLHAFFGEQVMPSQHWWLPVLIVGTLLVVAAYTYLIKNKAPLWMALALSAAAGCLVVPTSGDYKLLYFIPAIISLLSEEQINRSWLPGAVLLCLIITPKPYGLRQGNVDPFRTAGVYVTPLLMIVLTAWIVTHLRVAKHRQESSTRGA